jgi:hypothetical protein
MFFNFVSAAFGTLASGSESSCEGSDIRTLAESPIEGALPSRPYYTDSKSQTKEVIVDFLQECDVPYQVIPFDTALYNACVARAELKGYPVSGQDVAPAFLKAMRVGVVITRTSYGHLEDYERLIWMVLWTAFVTFADDAFQEDIHHLHSFNRAFLQNEKHEHPVLESFASFLRDCSTQFPDFVANTIVSSALRFMMSISLEFEGQTAPVSSFA